MLDGAPIIVVATGLNKGSINSKTGALIQTWILREDIKPTLAVKNGAAKSVCGDCPHIGDTCYVNIFQAPLNVYNSYHRGIYKTDWTSATFAGRKIRIGSYGDPAAVPYYIWERVLAETVGHTGYTHQWRNYPELAAIVMASCDTPQDRLQAKFLGFRTFRVRLATEPKLDHEFLCPASKEAGVKTNCAACLACGGTTAKAKADPVIIAHGAASKVNAFTRWRAAA
jgi:hypothetical protein